MPSVMLSDFITTIPATVPAPRTASSIRAAPLRRSASRELLSTYASGVNAAGVVFGYYLDNTGQHGFIDQGGTIMPINVAGANSTYVTGVDAAGAAFGGIPTIPARMASSIKAAPLRRSTLRELLVLKSPASMPPATPSDIIGTLPAPRMASSIKAAPLRQSTLRELPVPHHRRQCRRRCLRVVFRQ